MEFLPPDPERYRISDCGRYVIEKINCGGKPVYCTWEYHTQRGGYASMADAREALMRVEFNRYQAAPELGAVTCCPECGRPDGARASPPREMLDSEL